MTVGLYTVRRPLSENRARFHFNYDGKILRKRIAYRLWKSNGATLSAGQRSMTLLADSYRVGPQKRSELVSSSHGATTRALSDDFLFSFISFWLVNPTNDNHESLSYGTSRQIGSNRGTASLTPIKSALTPICTVGTHPRTRRKKKKKTSVVQLSTFPSVYCAYTRFASRSLAKSFARTVRNHSDVASFVGGFQLYYLILFILFNSRLTIFVPLSLLFDLGLRFRRAVHHLNSAIDVTKRSIIISVFLVPERKSTGINWGETNPLRRVPSPSVLLCASYFNLFAAFLLASPVERRKKIDHIVWERKKPARARSQPAVPFYSFHILGSFFPLLLL